MPAGRPRNLNLSDIRIDGGTQVRAAINDATVSDYADAIERGEKLPAVIVYDDGSAKWLADGFHRWHAHKRRGSKQIAAQVEQGSRDDAAWYALAANRANGLPLSQADKRRAIGIALKMRPESSNNSIAKHVGCSDHTVSSVRSEMELTSQIAKSPNRVGSDGRTYNTSSNSQIAKCSTKQTSDGRQYPAHRESPPVVPTDDQPPSVGESPPHVPVATDGDESTDVPTLASVEDRLGQLVMDDRLAEAFSRDAELVELCTTISKIKSQVNKAIEGKDPLYADLVPNQIITDLTNVRRQLNAARPFTTCPYCGGDGCQACYGRGWVNELAYKAKGRH